MITTLKVYWYHNFKKLGWHKIGFLTLALTVQAVIYIA
jgi:hypothetical protein